MILDPRNESMSLTPIFDSIKPEVKEEENVSPKENDLMVLKGNLISVPGISTDINQIYPISDILKSPIEMKNWDTNRRMK